MLACTLSNHHCISAAGKGHRRALAAACWRAGYSDAVVRDAALEAELKCGCNVCFFSENTLCYLFLLTHESQEIFGLKCMILYDHYLNLVSYITFRLFWVDISCGR